MYKLLEINPALLPYEKDINLRMDQYNKKLAELTGRDKSLKDFANAYEYYGFHELEYDWVYREWAPGADGVYLTGDFNGWNQTANPLTRINEHGDWEIHLPKGVIFCGSKVRTIVRNGDKLTEHLPLFTRRAVQDPDNYNWCAEVYDKRDNYPWTDYGFHSEEPVIIYEAHVGMAQDELRIGSYREFADIILPRIKEAGYTTIQLMAIMEHPFYGSFGYQVSNFYAASSRFGMPDDLKYLVNKAHAMGIRVLLDVVHSHAVKNTLEGINLFDGTVYQFFHDGMRGEHPAWGTKCFNYENSNVIHFLLSNLKFWMMEYHFDGFRFDGVTSMLYLHHGLGVDFDSLTKYYSPDTDIDAIVYLQLANKMIREVNPYAVTIAEDMSGMPGMTDAIEDGGMGFDYRLAMGLPDMWIKNVKKLRDEQWDLDGMWKELSFRQAKTVAYLESHDQALVGDQTMMFRLAADKMYTEMQKDVHTDIIDRATALHKMMRLITAMAGGEAYLAFMGNEFGHPEWIDFPRPENGSSFQYCRRQWSLLYNPELKYQYLNKFDKDMVALIKDYKVFDQRYADLRWIHAEDRIMAFERGGLLFVFNWHATKAYENYTIPVIAARDYVDVLSSDDPEYGGFGRITKSSHSAQTPGKEGNFVSLYLPPRTALVLRQSEDVKPKKKRAPRKTSAAKKTTKKKTK